MSSGKFQSSVMTREDLREPKDYDVVFHNDNVTTMDFVVSVLRSVFYKSQSDAVQLMLMVHNSGSATIGTYSYDIAKTKSEHVMKLALEQGFPLQVTVVPNNDDDVSLPF